MDINTVRGLITLVLMVLFIALIIVVYRRKKSDYDDAANLPFVGDDTNPTIEQGDKQ